jgi:hypothetical protein
MDTQTAPDQSDDRPRNGGGAESLPTCHGLVTGALCLGGGAIIALAAILG